MNRYQKIAETSDENRQRYSEVVRRLYDRYSDGNGKVIISVGGKPTKYRRLEFSAFERYVINNGARKP